MYGLSIYTVYIGASYTVYIYYVYCTVLYTPKYDDSHANVYTSPNHNLFANLIVVKNK